MKKKRTNRKLSPFEQGSVDMCVPALPVEPRLPCRGETKIELPAGDPDLEALRAVTREWLVPLLVEKFLRQQGVELRARPNTSSGKTPISDLYVEEVGGSLCDPQPKLRSMLAGARTGGVASQSGSKSKFVGRQPSERVASSS